MITPAHRQQQTQAANGTTQQSISLSLCVVACSALCNLRPEHALPLCSVPSPSASPPSLLKIRQHISTLQPKLENTHPHRHRYRYRQTDRQTHRHRQYAPLSVFCRARSRRTRAPPCATMTPRCFCGVDSARSTRATCRHNAVCGSSCRGVNRTFRVD